jgi:hypothetical protein
MSVAVGEGVSVTVSTATDSAAVGEGCAATDVASAVGVVSGEGCAATVVASAVGVVSGEGCATTVVASTAGVSVGGRVGSGSTVGSAPPFPGSGNPAHPVNARRRAEIQIIGRMFRIDLVFKNQELRTKN